MFLKMRLIRSKCATILVLCLISIIFCLFSLTMNKDFKTCAADAMMDQEVQDSSQEVQEDQEVQEVQDSSHACHKEISDSRTFLERENVEFSCEALEIKGCERRFEKCGFCHSTKIF